MALNQGLMKSM